MTATTLLKAGLVGAGIFGLGTVFIHNPVTAGLSFTLAGASMILAFNAARMVRNTQYFVIPADYWSTLRQESMQRAADYNADPEGRYPKHPRLERRDGNALIVLFPQKEN